MNDLTDYKSKPSINADYPKRRRRRRELDSQFHIPERPRKFMFFRCKGIQELCAYLYPCLAKNKENYVVLKAT